MDDRDAAVAFCDDLTRRRLAVRSVVEAGRLDDAGVAPPINNDAGDIGASVEARRTEELRHVAANQTLVIRVAGFEQSLPSACDLFRHRLTRRVEPHIE